MYLYVLEMRIIHRGNINIIINKTFFKMHKHENASFFVIIILCIGYTGSVILYDYGSLVVNDPFIIVPPRKGLMNLVF